MQPVFKDCECFGGEVSEDLFDRGLCLPSGSNLTDAELDRVIQAILKVRSSATVKVAAAVSSLQVCSRPLT
jgi:dTDP-4-amino-4,6-dideoxygalactose transaminase